MVRFDHVGFGFGAQGALLFVSGLDTVTTAEPARGGREGTGGGDTEAGPNALVVRGGGHLDGKGKSNSTLISLRLFCAS